MAINIREGDAENAVRALAAKLGVSLTDAIHIAASNELKRLDTAVPLAERVDAIRRGLRDSPQVGDPAPAGKPSFDELSGT